MITNFSVDLRFWLKWINFPSGLPGPRAPRRRGREQQDTAEARLEM